MTPFRLSAAIVTVFVFATCAFQASTLSGQTDDAAGALDDIRETGKAYLEAFNQADAKAVAALWTTDGTYVDQNGVAVQGREALETAFEEFFEKNKSAKLTLQIEKLELLGENVAVEIGDSELTVPGDEAKQGARYKAIHVKQEDGWKLQLVEEGPPLPDSNYEHLKELEWMIGDWVDEKMIDDKQQVAVHTRAAWSVNRNFVVRTFTETVNGRVTLTATQRIGWYAPKNQIRSWAFDSDGGVSVAIWSKNGDGWGVQTDHLFRDGKQLMEMGAVTIDNEHQHTWRFTDRTLAGEKLPDEVIEVRRLGTEKKP